MVHKSQSSSINGAKHGGVGDFRKYTVGTPFFCTTKTLHTKKEEAQRLSHQQLSDLAEEHQRLYLSFWQPEMVLMEIKSPEELASVGVVGCLKEAGKLICHHARLFLLITLATYLPFFISHHWFRIPELEQIQDFFNGHRLVLYFPRTVCSVGCGDNPAFNYHYTRLRLHNILYISKMHRCSSY